ncbi:MAG: prepilin-type N-terminal cleavage/methylation domain-containing protein [bacterium]|nr:prepilin-type N-terminal cleavage/methylation domain-containing protein [bacterium]
MLQIRRWAAFANRTGTAAGRSLSSARLLGDLSAASRTRQNVLSRSRRAFTLIEVLVACVLSAVLLAALVGIFRALLLESRDTGSTAISPIAAARIQTDLLNATAYRFESGILDLAGPIALDPYDHQPLWQEARVRYRVHNSSQGGILIREQEIGSGPLAIRSASPMWVGIRALELRSDHLESVTYSQADERMFESALSDGWRSLPDAVQFRLRDLSNRVSFSESMVSVQHD